MLSVASWADSIKEQTVGCPTIEILKNIPKETANDYIKLNLFTMANDCMILSRNDKVEAIDYDPANNVALFMKIVHKQSGKILFVPTEDLYIEQPGKKNIFRF